MSRFVTTDFGRWNMTSDGPLWECPLCGAFGRMSEDQLAGHVSVICAGVGGTGCTYHETHPFGSALVARMQARILTGTAPIDEEPANGR